MKAPEDRENVDTEERKDWRATQAGYQEPQDPRETTKVKEVDEMCEGVVGVAKIAGIVRLR